MQLLRVGQSCCRAHHSAPWLCTRLTTRTRTPATVLLHAVPFVSTHRTCACSRSSLSHHPTFVWLRGMCSDLRRCSSAFITRSKNVLLLFPVIPDRLPSTLRVHKGMRNRRLRVCMGHCARQGKRDHMEDRVALVPAGLRFRPGATPPCETSTVLVAPSQQTTGAGYAALLEEHTAVAEPALGVESPEFCFAGVYDGHAGHKVADYLKCYLHVAVASHLSVQGNHTRQLEAAFEDVDQKVCRSTDLSESGSCAVVACVIPRTAESPSRVALDVGRAAGSAQQPGVAEADQATAAPEAVVCRVESQDESDDSPASNPRASSPVVPTLSLGAGGAGAGSSTSGSGATAVLSSSTAAAGSQPSPSAGHARMTSRLLFTDGGNPGDAAPTPDGLMPHIETHLSPVAPPPERPLLVVRSAPSIRHSVTEGGRPQLRVTPSRSASAARLLIAHVGDSAAILCRAGTAEAVCTPHKPTMPLEAARIQAAGGMVASNGRIHGILDTSRAFGDVGFKASFKESGNRLHRSNVVVAKPDVMEFDLLPSDEFLILASDGLLSVMNMQQAVNLVKRQLLDHGDVDRAAELLVAQAINAQHATDNVSVVIICFHQVGSERQEEDDGDDGNPRP